jgi:spermidine synthase
MKQTYSSIPFVFIGFSSLLLQITVLRLLLSTFSGNELDIGITLSFWLLYVGLGSFSGRRIRLKHAFIFSFIFIALITQPTVLVIKAIRPLLSLEPGEVVSFTSTILSTALTLFPLCFVIGIQFPLAVSYAGTKDAAGRVYGLEALGAFIAGLLFTFVVSSRIDFMELSLFIACFNILIACYLSRNKIMFFLLLIPLSFFFVFHSFAMTLPWQGLKLSRTIESKYGEIAVIEMKDQSSIYTNGQLLYTYPDVPSEEFRAHLTMTLHTSPLKLLVIGGSPGTLRELLKYPVERIDFIELDPRIVQVSSGILNSEDRKVMKDNRVNVIVEDGRRFIKRLKKTRYDLVFLNLQQPSTAGINRFYTSDFFVEAKGVLKEYGILALTIPPSTGYIGKSMQTANGSIYNSLRSVFQHVSVTAQEYGGLFASHYSLDTDPEILEKRFEQRGIAVKHFSPYIFREVFSPFGVDYVRNRLDKIDLINSDLRPSAYLYNVMVWSEIHGGKVITYLMKISRWHIVSFLVVFFITIPALTFKRKRRVLYYSIFTTGFAGMSFVLAVILAYQALYGYIYEMIGILTATFMVGMWAGTRITKRTERSLNILFYLELFTVALALTAPLFFRGELLFYGIVFLAGICTGGQFTTANLSMDSPDTAGKLYGLDLIGSCIGSFIPAIILIPLFGVSKTLLLIAVMKAVSAVLILSVRTGTGMTEHTTGGK